MRKCLGGVLERGDIHAVEDEERGGAGTLRTLRKGSWGWGRVQDDRQ